MRATHLLPVHALLMLPWVALLGACVGGLPPWSGLPCTDNAQCGGLRCVNQVCVGAESAAAVDGGGRTDATGGELPEPAYEPPPPDRATETALPDGDERQNDGPSLEDTGRKEPKGDSDPGAERDRRDRGEVVDHPAESTHEGGDGGVGESPEGEPGASEDGGPDTPEDREADTTRDRHPDRTGRDGVSPEASPDASCTTGAIRPCYGGPAGTAGVALCRSGVQRCISGSWERACVGQVLPIAETCNGKDDDCDGTTDEGPGGATLARPCYTGPAGTSGVGECRAGRQVCASGTWAASCVGQTVPIPETCNGKDDNCDGKTDIGGDGKSLERDCYSGQTGTKGVGECSGGREACTGGAWSGTCVGETVPTPETCDGKDNDCDGKSDEELQDKDKPCTVPGKLGECAVGKTVCLGGKPGCVGPKQSTETCDGKDNDCDGKIDEEFPELGRVCTVTGAKGECANGKIASCSGGRPVCSGPSPADEVCGNTRDDNCNGLIDETVVYTFSGSGIPGHADGPAGTARYAEPYAVAWASAGGGYLVDRGNHRVRKVDAAGAVGPLAGTGQAGYVDGDLKTARFNAPSGIAVGPSGKVYVADGGNHCIRAIDGAVVRTLAGACGTSGFADGSASKARFNSPNGLAVMGTYLLVADTGNNVIRAVLMATGSVITIAGSGTPGYKDDTRNRAEFRSPIDLVVDQGGNIYVTDSLNHAVRKVVGAFRRGGTVTTEAGTGTPGKDDGEALKARFSTPWGIALDQAGNIFVADRGNHAIRTISSGRVSTLAGGTRGSVDGPGATASFETLSGLGTGPANLLLVLQSGTPKLRRIVPCSIACKSGATRICYFGPQGTAGKGICRSGSQQCGASQSWGPCIGQTLPTVETCNGHDDDCNGAVDDLVDIGKQCRDVSRTGECQLGVWQCEKSGKVCKQTWRSTAETCNQLDDDCDGKIDETFPELNKACTAPGKKGECADGKWTACTGGIKVCTGPPATAEVCDGKDNDCDGSTDESFPELNTVCTVPRKKGECARGKWTSCSAAKKVCTGPASATEICDGKDNDCDGSTDESFPELSKACTVPGKKGECAKGKWTSCSAARKVCTGPASATEI